ncbi:hypothetical protein CVT24_003677 [Panaeolus cyanescens]|uniref:Uncharacterized protein n=1 Tax=Panaeolus cyanescens TaxID=181874 RepID=A0A409VUQ4_9AGAR|nr:hypothetical protein CVT24_003677 [Panaeolus cyanescens]
MFKSFTNKYHSLNSSQSSFSPLNPSGKKDNSGRVFGELSSQYGFNGGVPCRPPKNPSTKSSRKQSCPQPHNTPNVVLPQSSTTKNYEQSYGDLVSLYGFGGGVPCLPPSQKKPKSSSKGSTNPPPIHPHHTTINNRRRRSTSLALAN